MNPVDGGNPSLPISDKAGFPEQRTVTTDNEKYNRSFPEDVSHEKFKKKNPRSDSRDFISKENRRDFSETEFPPVAGVTFPSVKGAEGLLCYILIMFIFR